jgi:colanic acid biosynthesis glycosyl transferase WcaI
LGISGWILSKIVGAKLIVNVQDIYPDIAIQMGVFRHKAIIRFFESMERWVYRRADKIVVISDGFRRNLLTKNVPDGKICIVPNWADPDEIRPGTRDTAFRRELGIRDEFMVLYSGGLTFNSDLSALLQAADVLRGGRFRFVIVGEGIRKADLIEETRRLRLDNVHFLPFQPASRYPEVLASADATIVTLNESAKFASLPSKVYKQMAAGRPIIGLADPSGELGELIATSRCGVCVAPSDSAGLTNALRRAAETPEAFRAMGANGRQYLEKYCSRKKSVGAIAELLAEISPLRVGKGTSSSAVS